MDKKGICVITKNKVEAYSFKALLEAKTSVKWADGSLPTQVDLEYKIFCFEPNPYDKFNAMTGASYEQLKADKDNSYGFFKDLTNGKYDIYVL